MLVKLMSVFDNLSTSQDGVLSLVFLWPLQGIYNRQLGHPPALNCALLPVRRARQPLPTVLCWQRAQHPVQSALAEAVTAGH
jgi:hypothetical protein